MKLWRWLLQWHAKRRLARVVMTTEENAKQLPHRLLCEMMLHEINVAEFALYQSTAAAGIHLRATDKTIEAYTERIRTIIKDLEKGRPVNVEFDANIQTVSLEEFLTSSKGYYLDVEKAVQRLKESGYKLCDLMTKTDHADVGVDEYNRRALTKFFINLQQVAHVLVEVSLSN